MRKFAVVKLRNGLREAGRKSLREWKRLLGGGGNSNEAKNRFLTAAGNPTRLKKGF